MNGTIPLRKEIRVALRAKRCEAWTSRQTQKQAKGEMVVIESRKGCQMLKRRRQRLDMSRWLIGSNEMYSKKENWH